MKSCGVYRASADFAKWGLPEIKLSGLTPGQSSLAAADGPARYDLRKTGDVSLAVAAVHAEGVQF